MKNYKNNIYSPSEKKKKKYLQHLQMPEPKNQES